MDGQKQTNDKTEYICTICLDPIDIKQKIQSKSKTGIIDFEKRGVKNRKKGKNRNMKSGPNYITPCCKNFLHIKCVGKWFESFFIRFFLGCEDFQFPSCPICRIEIIQHYDVYRNVLRFC